MDETPYQKKNRERGEVRAKLQAIGQKLNLGCDFLPMFNGPNVDVTAWKGNTQHESGRSIRIAKEDFLVKPPDEILAAHRTDFFWIAGIEVTKVGDPNAEAKA